MARRDAHRAPRCRQRGDHVAGDHALCCSLPTGSLAACLSMQLDARGGCGKRLHPLCEQRRDRAGEHVAGAGCGERGTVAAADRNTAGGLDDERVVALEHNDRFGLLGCFARMCEPLALYLFAVYVQQSRQLAGMRREHRRRLSHRKPSKRPSVGVQAVGVEHQRKRCFTSQLAREAHALGIAAEPRAERQAAGASKRVLDRGQSLGRERTALLGQATGHHLQ